MAGVAARWASSVALTEVHLADVGARPHGLAGVAPAPSFQAVSTVPRDGSVPIRTVDVIRPSVLFAFTAATS